MRIRMPPNYCRNRSHSLLKRDRRCERWRRWWWVWREEDEDDFWVEFETVFGGECENENDFSFCNLIFIRLASFPSPLRLTFFLLLHTFILIVAECIKMFSFSFHCLLKIEYLCHGSWVENGTTFIIARHSGTKHGVCISFRPSSTDSTAAQLIIGDSCYRETMLSEIPEHHLISNVTGVVRKYLSNVLEKHTTFSTILSSFNIILQIWKLLFVQRRRWLFDVYRHWSLMTWTRTQLKILIALYSISLIFSLFFFLFSSSFFTFSNNPSKRTFFLSSSCHRMWLLESIKYNNNNDNRNRTLWWYKLSNC